MEHEEHNDSVRLPDVEDICPVGAVDMEPAVSDVTSPPALDQEAGMGDGCTLDGIVTLTGLPRQLLAKENWTDINDTVDGVSVKAVRIAYWDEEGTEVSGRVLGSRGGQLTHHWTKRSKPALYGLQHLRDVVDQGFIYLVSDEIDAVTLWHHGIPALGLPGIFIGEWGEKLKGFNQIHLVLRRHSKELETQVRSSIPPDKLTVVRLWDHGLAHIPCGNSLNDLYRADVEGFTANLGEITASAMADKAMLEVNLSASRWHSCKRLATSESVLDEFAAAIAHRVPGFEDQAKLIYLAITSRLLPTPVSVLVKAQSSAGKSWLVGSVLDFFPPSAIARKSKLSPKTIAFEGERLSHKMLMVQEVSGLSTEAAGLVRTLLSEGVVEYETVEMVDGSKTSVTYTTQGPTGLLMTTTRNATDAELQNRMLTIKVEDDDDQLAIALDGIAQRYMTTDHAPVVPGEFHAYQEWLQQSVPVVKVPFADHIAQGMEKVSATVKRDLVKVLSLVSAHALLQQEHRQLDEDGAVIATLDDYRIVHELVWMPLALSYGNSVHTRVRQVVSAVEELQDGHPGRRVSQIGLVRHLGWDRATVHDWVQEALVAGFLIDDRHSHHGESRLCAGLDLPGGDTSVLPHPNDIEQAIGEREWAGAPPLPPVEACLPDADATDDGQDYDRQARRDDRLARVDPDAAPLEASSAQWAA